MRARADQSKLVEDWNAKHAEGTAVTVAKDDGRIQRTVTLSEAWLLGGHTAVIKLHGISGCYSLERVKPVVEEKKTNDA